jgi:hypothetical protein
VGLPVVPNRRKDLADYFYTSSKHHHMNADVYQARIARKETRARILFRDRDKVHSTEMKKKRISKDYMAAHHAGTSAHKHWRTKNENAYMDWLNSGASIQNPRSANM